MIVIKPPPGLGYDTPGRLKTDTAVVAAAAAADAAAAVVAALVVVASFCDITLRLCLPLSVHLVVLVIPLFVIAVLLLSSCCYAAYSPSSSSSSSCSSCCSRSFSCCCCRSGSCSSSDSCSCSFCSLPALLLLLLLLQLLLLLLPFAAALALAASAAAACSHLQHFLSKIMYLHDLASYHSLFPGATATIVAMVKTPFMKRTTATASFEAFKHTSEAKGNHHHEDHVLRAQQKYKL